MSSEAVPNNKSLDEQNGEEEEEEEEDKEEDEDAEQDNPPAKAKVKVSEGAAAEKTNGQNGIAAGGGDEVD